ncbi:MAG: N-acetyl-alpha-D-glucosaminyl L-malate synthase BshA [Bacteroidia bacterium]|nr:N-acetyl-alpha-D-glucosaminyl L-malate synthase BshA [Bacteroidia bacterium]
MCYPTYGGSGVVATELGKALSLRGHNVHFITYDRPVRLDGFAHNIFYHQVSPEKYPLFEFLPYESALASKLVEVVQFARLDLLHVHYAIPHASSTYLAQQILAERGVRIPFVTTLHGTDITLVGKEEAFEPVVSFSINRSTGVTAVSEYLRQATYANFHVTRPIEVIPNFVDLSRFQRADKTGELRKRFTPQGEKLLVHVSNFRRIKRVGDVYAVFKHVRTEVPTRLLLIGDGPERAPLERQVHEDGLHGEVFFLGNQGGIEQVIGLGDVFLMPSETESFGLAALEAMACGLPVVCSNAGGLPELVCHGECGLYADVGDVATLSEHTLRLLSSPDELSRFSEAAYARAQRFDVTAVVPRYEDYYQAVRAANSP